MKIERKSSNTLNIYTLFGSHDVIFTAEIDNYVQSKYGQGSGWHLQDNGYVDLDKAGYTNDGRKL